MNETTCPTCKGMGEVRRHEFGVDDINTCPVCDGKGTVAREKPYEELRAEADNITKDKPSNPVQEQAHQKLFNTGQTFEEVLKTQLRDVLLKSGQFSNTTYREPDLGAWWLQSEAILAAHEADKQAAVRAALEANLPFIEYRAEKYGGEWQELLESQNYLLDQTTEGTEA